MNAELQSALAFNLAAVLTHVGTRADYRVGGTATAVYVSTSIAELADDLAQRPSGHDRVRLADILVPRSDLGQITPAHGDTLTVLDGAHAGTWTVLGIERLDEVQAVLRARRSVRVDAATPGATDLRR